MASMDKECKFQPGDRVACAGQDYASHAEIVSIPQNLVARVPDNVSFEEAAFTTLGAIALQGVRQAEPRLGENVCVIGLGLLGQLTCQLLRANGCHVLGIDLSDRLVALAQQHSADKAINRSQADVIKTCNPLPTDLVLTVSSLQRQHPPMIPSNWLRRFCAKKEK